MKHDFCLCCCCDPVPFLEAVINFFKDRGPKLLVQQEWDWWNIMALSCVWGMPLPCQDGVSLVNEEVHHFVKQQD